MKYIKKALVFIVLGFIVFLFFVLNQPAKLTIPNTYQTNNIKQIMNVEQFIDSDFTIAGYDLVAENDFLKLFIDMKTSYFAVYDKRNDYIWHSNFDVVDIPASRTYRNMQRSTLTLTYKQTDNTTRTWSNYEFSIAGQYFDIDLERIENGFVVNYAMADRNPKGFWFPTKISRDRYIQLVLNPFEEYEFATPMLRNEYSNYLRNAYVQMTDDPDTYILALVTSDKTSNDLAGVDVQYLFEIFYEIGLYGNVFDENGEKSGEYHLDDVAIDNEMYEYFVDLAYPEFDIPLKIELKEDHLSTEIMTSEIVQRSPFEIVSIRMLPYVGATTEQDQGYIVVPEGSGGLMYLNNGKYRQRSYTTHFYGRDQTLIQSKLEIEDEGARLPIFGVKTAENAILAIIEEGAEHAILTAEVSAKNDMFNKVYSDFKFKDSGLYYLTQAGILIWHPDQYTYHPKINYYFFAEEEANYASMAKLYSLYIKEKYRLNEIEQHKRSLFLDVLGSYDFDDYFMFFPYKNTRALTTFEALNEMIETLESNQIESLVINYIGWFNKGINHELPDQIQIDRVLGSRRELNHLLTSLNPNHRLYFDVDFIKLYDKPLLYSNHHFTRIVGGTEAKFYPFDVASRLPNTLLDPTYHLKHQTIYENIDGFIKDFDKIASSNLSLRNFGQLHYSDFHRNHSVFRYEATAHMQNMLSIIDQRHNILLSHPNDYALAFTTDLSDLTFNTSQFLMVDQAIPFYQIAIAPFISYAMPSINMDQVFDFDYYFLKAVETGSSLKFTVSDQNSSLLMHTKYNHYIQTSFSRLLPNITNMENRLKMLNIHDAYLIDHKIVNDHVVIVTYSNQSSFIIDYMLMTIESL